MNDTAYDENGMKYSRMCLRMEVINYFNEEVMAQQWFDEVFDKLNNEFDYLLTDVA